MGSVQLARSVDGAVLMVRRRSTVRFRNGAPLKDQVRSSLDSSHPTLRMGAVAVLGGIWEIVFYGPAELARSPARVSRETPGSTAETGRPTAPSHWDALSTGVSPLRPSGHEMITRLEPIGKPWQRKPGPGIPSRLTGRIITASLHGSGEGSRLASIAAGLLEPRARPIGARKPVLRGLLSVPSIRPSCSRCIVSTAAA